MPKVFKKRDIKSDMAKEERDENSDPVDFLCYTSWEFEEKRKEIMYFI